MRSLTAARPRPIPDVQFGTYVDAVTNRPHEALDNGGNNMHPQPRMILLLALFALIASPCMFAQQANTSPATAPAATPSSAPAPAHTQAAACAPKPSET